MTKSTSLCTPLNVLTFNVNDLGQDPKRIAIFNKLKLSNGIILLQETQSTSKKEKEIGKTNGEVKLSFLMVPRIVKV